VIKVRSLSEVLRNETVSSRARAFLSPLRGARDRIIIFFFEEDRETAKRGDRKKKTNAQHRKGFLAQRHTYTHSRAYLLIARLFLFVFFYCYVGLNGFS